VSFPTFDFAAPRATVTRALRYGTKLARKVAPRGFNVSEPICQLFLNGFGKYTRYTFTNFPSLYSPPTASHCYYDLTLYDEVGSAVARTHVSVPAFASVEVRLEDVARGPLPALGVVAARFRPGSPLSYADKHLGTITSHFYALYHDAGMESLSVVHPQTALWADSPPPVPWRSNLLILPELIDALEIFQLNPTPRPVESTISLCALDGTALLSARGRMPPRSARRTLWHGKDLPAERYLVLASDALAAPNAKPLLFQHYQGRFFSAAHT